MAGKVADRGRETGCLRVVCGTMRGDAAQQDDGPSRHEKIYMHVIFRLFFDLQACRL